MKHTPMFVGLLLAAISVHDDPSRCEAQESRIISWNSHSRQFIDPPAFQLLSLAKTRKYRAIVEDGGRSWQVESPHPWLNLSAIWDKLPLKSFKLVFQWLDADGKVLAEESSSRVKAPDWQGFKESPDDWAAAADRTIAYLIRVGEQGAAPYREPGVPTWIWSAASPTPEPTRQMLGPAYDNKRVLEEFRNRHRWAGSGHPVAYPDCIVPAIIWSMTAHAQLHRPQSEVAMKTAHLAADWALKNRLPDDGVFPGFPYSTIAAGRFGGALERDNINLTRASWMGLGMVTMYEATKERKYLDYARHIAQVTARFQAADGSFPYRVNFKTGNVKEAYCTGGIQFSLLVEALQRHDVDEKLQLASERRPMAASLPNGIAQLARWL